MERGDAAEVAEALLQIGVQEQEIFKTFLQRIQFGAEHLELVRKLQSAFLQNNAQKVAELSQAILAQLELRFDAVSRYVQQEAELHKKELANQGLAKSLLTKEFAEAQQAMADASFTNGSKLNLSAHLAKIDKELALVIKEHTLDKHIEYAMDSFRRAINAQAKHIQRERELLQQIAAGSQRAVNELMDEAGALQLEVRNEKRDVIEPLNIVLKQKFNIDTLLRETAANQVGHITIADIKEDLRSLSTPAEVNLYLQKLNKYAHFVDAEAFEDLKHYDPTGVVLRYGSRAAYKLAQAGVMTDSMTGIASKKNFDLTLPAKIRVAEQPKKEDEKPRCVSLIYFDIDRFKPINDTYGHDVGDVVIKTIVGIVRVNIKQTDMFARVGGEEFAVITDEDRTQAAATAERIREEIERKSQKVIAERKITDRASVTVSLGVGTYYGTEQRLDQAASETAADVLKKLTDEAQYASKNSGKNKVTVAKPITAQNLFVSTPN